MKKLFYALIVFFSAVVYAALPSGAVVIEAETFECSNKAWVKRPHFPGYYGSHPSGGAHLMGSNGIAGTAAKVIKIDKPGKYHLWVRYIDLNANRARSGFILRVKKDGKVVAEKEFDRNSLRSTPEGMKKWGRGYGLFVWDKIAFDAADAGEYSLEVSKLQKGAMTTAGGRHLDVFLLTGDLAFEPRITDLNPLFVRVKILEEQKTPAAMHFFGIRSEGTFGWYMKHSNINKKGWFFGAEHGAGNMKKEYFKAGDVSQWHEISQFLSFSGYDRLSFYLITSYHAPRLETAAFELQFSRTPSEEKLWKTFRRTGKGCGLQIAVNMVKGELLSEIDASNDSVKFAEQAGNVSGKKPEKFPVNTGLSLDPAYAPETVMENETAALAAIGINGTGSIFSKDIFPVYRAAKYCFHLHNGCLNRPDAKRIDALFKNFAAQVKAGNAPAPYVINIMDEPGLKTSHFTGCAYCKGEFANYLKNIGVSLSNNTFTANPADGIRYYWSMRYANSIITKFFKTASVAVARHFPGIPVTANFATSLVYDGNMISDHCDWYDILGSGALTYGWGEDWANHTRTYQSNGFYTDVLRSACRIKGYEFGIYNIICGRNSWDIQAKGYMAIGRGAKALGFHNYGPWYVMSSDASNQFPHTFSAIKKISFPTGEVEDELLAASTATGDAAMLFSRTSDIWNLKKDNVFGKERVFLNLLLKHCSFSTDIIDEENLAAELKNYRLLIACDSHIRKEFVPIIVDWVKNGGTLYMTAGALQFDESNQPLELRKALNVTDDNFTLSQNPGTAHHSMHRLRTLGTYADMPLVAGIQQPLHQVKKSGKGQVIATGFFPGISYIAKAKVKKQYSFLNYPEAHRKYIAALPLTVKPRLTSSNYLVEANMQTGRKADVIVLANFAGEPAETTLTFSGTYRDFKAVNAVIVKQEKSGGKNQITLKLDHGGAYLVAGK